MSAVLYPTFIDAALNKDIEKLVELSRGLISSLEGDVITSNPKKVLAQFGIDLIYSSIPYEASIVVNDSLASLQVSLILNTRSRSNMEELFLIYHMLAHFLLDVQVRLLDENTETFAIVERGSPLIDRFYKGIRENEEYSKDMFTSYFLLPPAKLKEISTLPIDQIASITGVDQEFIKFRLNSVNTFTLDTSFQSYSSEDTQKISDNDQKLLKQGFTKSVATGSYKQAQATLQVKDQKQDSINTKNKDGFIPKNTNSYTLDPNTSVGLKMLRNLASKISQARPKKEKEKQSKIS